MTEFPPSTPTDRFPYQIEGVVGEGAMGVVYRAREMVLDRPVAIKVVRPEILGPPGSERHAEQRLRLVQEARVAAALSHPGATTIYRVGEEDRTPYIVMEWLEGRTLEALMSERGAMPPARAAEVGIRVLAPLAAAHAAGIVHRDIKPANLMLLRDGRLKVMDFGIARVRAGELVQTRAGIVLATPQFAAPEQLLGGELDGRADLFAVGALLYYLMHGQFAFRGETMMQLLHSLHHDDPGIGPHVPPALAAIVLRALAKRAEDRFASAAEMSLALRQAATHEPGAREARPGRGSSDPATATTRRLHAFVGAFDEPRRAVLAIAAAWPGRDLAPQPVAVLLERLLDRPLHAEPFAGAARVGRTWLLAADGLLLGACTEGVATWGDEAVESLPREASASLHPAPGPHGSRLVRALAFLLGERHRQQQDLDSSFVDLPALAERLQEGGFEGVLALERAEGPGWVLFERGELLRVVVGGGAASPGEAVLSWADLLRSSPVRAHVEAATDDVCQFSLRRELRELTVAVHGAGPPRPLTASGRFQRREIELSVASGSPLSPGAVDPGRDPGMRLLRWMLGELPAFLHERGRAARWKYLVEWLAEIRDARLYHRLPRPGGVETDEFDLVTFDEGGRALHVARRHARVSRATFEAFLADVQGAKTARKRSGDIGGAFLVARHFDAEVQALASKPAASAAGLLDLQESFTGYEGFVRVGPRRGYHLLLVEETTAGIQPLLPAAAV